MKHIMRRASPDNYKPHKHKFRATWVSRFCKRWKLSVQKLRNRKTKSAYERMHQIQNYHHWLIYDFQNPENFKGVDGYFDERQYLDVRRDVKKKQRKQYDSTC